MEVAQSAKNNMDNTPCTALKSVGSYLSKLLAKLNIETYKDLLLHLPFRYQDKTHLTPIRDLRVGDMAVIEGVINHAEVTKKYKPMLVCGVHDESDQLIIRFFHFYPNQQKSLSPGNRVRCFGEVRLGKYGLEMVHPEWRCIQEDHPIAVDENLTPIYPSTEGIPQYRWQVLMDSVLRLLKEKKLLQDILPKEFRQQFELLDLADAIKLLHRPPPEIAPEILAQHQHPARRRLAFEELLSYHLCMQRSRAQLQVLQAASLNNSGQLRQQFLSQLPFSLTNAQQRVVQEILNDVNQDKPMMRLLQGDVGCGKTVVATLALLQAVECGYQAVMMAPTEILAEQHYKNLQAWLKPLGINITFLSGKSKSKSRQNALAAIADGSAQIILGTHALFQNDVEFKHLSLVVIDEQHRFGVHQRLALREKGNIGGIYPHQLIMTATPIPRTLAMLFYADLDCSVIDELPPNRTPVTTVVVACNRRDEIIARVQDVCQQGAQVYWVCPLIEESEVLQCQAAEVLHQQLTEQLANIKIALIHGRLKSKEKETIMQAFKQGEIHLLVATTVIEVGVDVPNASLMIIENAERLGLSQLHQLRGRVGRGERLSHCVLLYQHPLSENAKRRLQVMRDTNDGFQIAREDLEIRGAGEMLGTKQAGLSQFRVADLSKDQDLLPKIQQATAVISKQYPHLVEALIQRWLGDNERYGGV